MEEFIPISEPYIARNQLSYVNDCVKTNWISSLGKYISVFEEKFSKFIGCDYGICTSNGTTALHLALEALGIGPGDEVIVPDFSFVATANSVLYTGAKPVFVDVNYNDCCINPGLIESKITKKTKAIIPVHLYGNSCDMDRILRIASEHKLYVIEDVAEAIGAKFKNKKAGSLSDISCFSFYGNKVITTGEGGMCLTNDETLKEKIELLKDHGMSKTKRYFHSIKGYNYRMTNIQAAIGVAQLEDIDYILKQRERINKKYSELLKDIDWLNLLKQHPDSNSICWLFSVVLSKTALREKLMNHLKNGKIDSRPFFYPMHVLPYFKENGNFEVSNLLSKGGVNLPTFTNLKDEQIQRICDSISSFAAR